MCSVCGISHEKIYSAEFKTTRTNTGISQLPPIRKVHNSYVNPELIGLRNQPSVQNEIWETPVQILWGDGRERTGWWKRMREWKKLMGWQKKKKVWSKISDNIRVRSRKSAGRASVTLILAAVQTLSALNTSSACKSANEHTKYTKAEQKSTSNPCDLPFHPFGKNK